MSRIKTIIENLRKEGYSDGFIHRALAWLNAQPPAFVRSLSNQTRYIRNNEYLINHAAIAHEHECTTCFKPAIHCRAIGCELPKWSQCLECQERGAFDEHTHGRSKSSHQPAEPQTYRAPYGRRRNRRKSE